MDLSDGFRLAMRRLASTVSIVSLRHDAERHGMTATSVTSVSMKPPSLLVCINRLGRLHDMIAVADRFCVNILHAEHEEVSRTFARPYDGERFICGDWGENGHSIPFLQNAQASLFCRKTLVVPYSSHSIVIGEIEDIRLRDDISPLIYQDGCYRALAAG